MYHDELYYTPRVLWSSRLLSPRLSCFERRGVRVCQSVSPWDEVEQQLHIVTHFVYSTFYGNCILTQTSCLLLRLRISLRPGTQLKEALHNKCVALGLLRELFSQ